MAREPGKLAIYFIVLTVLLDVIGFAIILPVLPVLITDLANVTLSQAATIGGYLLFLYALYYIS